MIVGLSFLLPVVCLTKPARAQKDPEVAVGKSLEVLSEITRNPKTGMPRMVLRRAGDRDHSRHVQDELHLRRPVWPRSAGGPPAGWHLEQPCLHSPPGRKLWSAGCAQSTDLVLVFQSRKGLDRFLKGKDKLTLGVDAAAAAGPVGKRFEASTDAGLQAEILSYSNTRGIFAGVSAEGGTLQIDWRANTLYYNQPVSPAAILAINSPLAVPPSTVSLQQLLAEKTAWPERVVKAGRPRKEPVIIDGEATFFDDPDGIEIDGAIRRDTFPDAAAPQPRAPARREIKPHAEPSTAADLDAIPPPTSQKKTPGQTRPQRPNDEDLPAALPGPAPSRAKQERKPLPSKPEDDDDLPDLAPPGTS